MRSMCELEVRITDGIDSQDSLECDATQHNDDFGLDEREFAFEEGLAVVEFFGCGFVAGRRATTRGGDVQILENQPVASRGRVGLVREPRAVEGEKEESARGVARELTACAVRAVRAGGESDHEDARLRVAKPGDGFAPVFLVAIGLAFFARNLFSPSHEARAFAAGDDLFVEGVERIHISCCVFRVYQCTCVLVYNISIASPKE